MNVNRIFEPFGVGVGLFELCSAVRQHEAQPSFIVNDPVVLTMLRFVKTEAVPREPILIAEIPALDPFWIVALVSVKASVRRTHRSDESLGSGNALAFRGLSRE